MSKMTHIDEFGCVRMVDVTKKAPTKRKATAQAIIYMSKETFENIRNNKVRKGNVLETARIAGIMAAKQSSNIIPMCHSLNLTHVKIDFFLDIAKNSIKTKSSVRTVGNTGVEIEALIASSIATITIYDMCKSYDKTMSITNICLLSKDGGSSGPFIR